MQDATLAPRIGDLPPKSSVAPPSPAPTPAQTDLKTKAGVAFTVLLSLGLTGYGIWHLYMHYQMESTTGTWANGSVKYRVPGSERWYTVPHEIGTSGAEYTVWYNSSDPEKAEVGPWNPIPLMDGFLFIVSAVAVWLVYFMV